MTSRTPLRLWPGVVIAILLVILRYVVPPVGAEAEIYSMPVAIIGILGGVWCAIAIVLWWLFFSRAPWAERLGAVIVMPAALFATSRLVHESIAGGMIGVAAAHLLHPAPGPRARRLGSGHAWPFRSALGAQRCPRPSCSRACRGRSYGQPARSAPVPNSIGDGLQLPSSGSWPTRTTATSRPFRPGRR